MTEEITTTYTITLDAEELALLVASLVLTMRITLGDRDMPPPGSEESEIVELLTGLLSRLTDLLPALPGELTDN